MKPKKQKKNLAVLHTHFFYFISRKTIPALIFGLVINIALASDPVAIEYTATRLKGSPPVIDGKLDDPAWQQGVWEGGFIQFAPNNGREATQKTEFMILFDDDNLYVAIRAWDNSPDSIVSRLGRRDHDDGDFVAIAFDSFYDLRTAFFFGANAGGVKLDLVISDDGQNEDVSWDPNWWVRTSIDEKGWVAEMQIPFNQLRFDIGSLWGLQVVRQVYRRGEMSFWSPLPSDSPGLVHRFGKLKGLEEIEPRTVFDITPYAVTSFSRYPAQPGNPFQTGNDNLYKLGMDAKIGLSNFMTLDLAVNPDFGQVEADPSEVNLTAYETFLQEKRPFFIEGSNISSFNLDFGGNENLFYSRRIGRSPHGNFHLPSGAFADKPCFTRILGAAKITGKTKDGLSVAIIETVTAEERAEVDLMGSRSFETVEPLTNYFVGRVQKDFNEGNTILGGMITSVHRNLNENLSDQMHRTAFSGGIDFSKYFSDKTWVLNIKTAASRVEGTNTALLNTQRSSARYFQRPDASHVRIDSTLTSLSGTSGMLQLGKFGGGHWNFMAALTWKSPGFEINDIGYMRTADQINQTLWIRYSQWEPKGFYRSYYISLSQNNLRNFEGQQNMSRYRIIGFMEFENFWSSNLSLLYLTNIWTQGHLRGGPIMRIPDALFSVFSISTDRRSKLVGSINFSHTWSDEDYSRDLLIGAGLTYKPFNNLDVSLNPFFQKMQHSLQFIGHADFEEQPRYLFGTLDQQVVNFSLRLNFTILPDLTIQYWGQPFIASGNFTDFKYITNPVAKNYAGRYQSFEADQIWLENGIYYIDENRDGAVNYQFGNPDYNVSEFLSNLVIRWEYNPGASLYLVWSQTRSGFDQYGSSNYMQNLEGLFTEKAFNTFLVKFTYRIGVTN